MTNYNPNEDVSSRDYYKCIEMDKSCGFYKIVNPTSEPPMTHDELEKYKEALLKAVEEWMGR